MDKTAENKAIGNRLRAFRERLRIPRSRFAVAIGFGSERMASYESGRAPLPYAVFVAIAKNFQINPFWLAGSAEQPFEWDETIEYPSIDSLNAHTNATFLEVFNGPIATLMARENIPPRKEIVIRQMRAKRFEAWIKTAFRDVPSEFLNILNDDVSKALLQIFKRLPSEDANRRFQRQIAYKTGGKSRMVKRVGTLVESISLLDLTQMLITPTSDGVQNQWHRLKSRILKATENPGGKSILAKFLDVDLTQLSRWLSKSGPEPGADYTLKMLQWVQERESQQ
jgi:transcriptional regulator with XRE-family HTH domain